MCRLVGYFQDLDIPSCRHKPITSEVAERRSGEILVFSDLRSEGFYYESCARLRRGAKWGGLEWCTAECTAVGTVNLWLGF